MTSDCQIQSCTPNDVVPLSNAKPSTTPVRVPPKTTVLPASVSAETTVPLASRSFLAINPSISAKSRDLSVTSQAKGYVAPAPVARQPGDGAPWADWAPWSACPQYGCANIQMQRSRACMGYGGYGCQGEPQQAQPCQCEPTPTWGPWSAPSQCDKTCGEGGQRSRTRQCSVPGQCPGPDSTMEACSLPSCSYWRDWSGWGACSKTCGSGMQTMTRVCVGQSCQGDRVQSQECVVGPCPAWQAWSAYGACSATCGSGERQRLRACSHGKLCDGIGSESDACPNLPPCPVLSPWSQWSECSRTCGEAKKQRVRECRNALPGQRFADFSTEQSHCFCASLSSIDLLTRLLSLHKCLTLQRLRRVPLRNERLRAAALPPVGGLGPVDLLQRHLRHRHDQSTAGLPIWDAVLRREWLRTRCMQCWALC